MPEGVIETPSPRAAGEIANCTSWFEMETFYTCEDVLNLYSLTVGEFYAFNPSVGSGCEAMTAGSYYCISTNVDGTPPGGYLDPTITTSGAPISTTSGVATITTKPSTTTTSGGIATPTPTQNGMITGCKAFYLVVANDGCWAICDSHGIELADFYQWNPDVGTDCANLWPDYYVCVMV